MHKNRVRPYGYKIVSGKTVIDTTEAETIRRIYKEYANGFSYKQIAEELTTDGIRYMPDKPKWNKNMVARILQNTNYLGTEKYPPITTEKDFTLAQKAVKPYNQTESQDIKNLKPLLVCDICGGKIKRRLKTGGVERWFCENDVGHIKTMLSDESLLQSIEELQNFLVQNPPAKSQQKKENNLVDFHTIRLQNEVDLALSGSSIDAEFIKNNILALTAKRYNLCCDKVDDTAELIAKIKSLSNAPLYSQVLKEIVAEIRVANEKAVTLVLKNGSNIPSSEKGETQDG